MKILIATDGSATARAATRFIERFPFPEKSAVTLLTVIDEEFFNPEAAGPLEEAQRQILRDAEKAAREDGEDFLEEEADRLRKTGWTASTLIRSGNPAQEIVQAADEIAPDLVVVGSKGTTGVSRFLLGSVSHQVMEYAPCSVLIVKPTDKVGESVAESSGPWRTLLAFDESAPSRRAIDLCASLPLKGRSEVTALTVLPMVTMFRQDIRQELNSIWQEKTHAARQALDQAAEALKQATPDVSVQLRESKDASHGILEAAEELDSDLIVLGRKGKRAIERFLLGSVTHHVARHAGCAVLIVR